MSKAAPLRRQLNPVHKRVPRDVEQRQLASIPGDTRGTTGRLLGDPLPGRSALDRRIREIVAEYHAGLKADGAWAEVLAALREMDRRTSNNPERPR